MENARLLVERFGCVELQKRIEGEARSLTLFLKSTAGLVPVA